MEKYAYNSPVEMRPEKVVNLVELSKLPFMGITASIRNKPWLVIGFDGENHILENAKGDLIKLNTPFEWEEATEKSALIAAARNEGSPIKAKLAFQGEWKLLHNGEEVPLEEIIEHLSKNNWDKDALYEDITEEVICPYCEKFDAVMSGLREPFDFYCENCGEYFYPDSKIAHQEGDRKDEKTDPLVCPECDSHSVDLEDRYENRFHCHSCGASFEKKVFFNPHSHVLAYEVDEEGDSKNYNHGPDNPKHITCDCGYSWKAHHKYELSCPKCGKEHAQEDVMAWEGKQSKLNFDNQGQELIVGNPYVMHSPNYKVPDVVYIVKSDPTVVEAAIEGDTDTLFPIKITEKELERYQYSFEPFISSYETAIHELGLDLIKNAQQFIERGVPLEDALGMSRVDFQDKYNDGLLNDGLSYAQDLVLSTGGDINTVLNEYAFQDEMIQPKPGEREQGLGYTGKVGFPYQDNLSDYDTNAVVREDPLDYDENVHNQSETASPAPLAPVGMPMHDETMGIHSPRNSVHLMQNPDGTQMLVMSNGEGGVMGWAPYNGEVDTKHISWATQNLHKIESAINQGMYSEVPFPNEQVISKIARKNFSPSEQRTFIDEGRGSLARNYDKLDISGTHYLKDEEENIYGLWW